MNANQSDFLIVMLTGQLPFILITSAILALPLAWLLLRSYRKAVMNIMSSRSSTSTSQPEPPSTPTNNQRDTPTLQLQFIESGQMPSTPMPTLWHSARHLFRRATVVHGLAGCVFALMMAHAYLIAGDMAFIPMQLAVMGCIYLWPVVLMLNLLTTTSPKRAWMNTALYFTLFTIINLIVITRNPGMAFTDLWVAWTTYNLPPTLLLIAFMNQRVRAVGPMVLVFMFIAITGAIAALSITGASENLLLFFTMIGDNIGLDTSALFIFILLLGFILFAIVGWLILKLIRRIYDAKRLSDQSMMLDSVILLFTIYYAINLAFEGVAWIFAGLAVFFVYQLLTRIGLKYLTTNPNPPHPLLVLRVFSLGKKSEQLFQAITQRWRYLGSVQLIAGPDLATTTIEPHEFLTFLSGKLKQQFISDDKTLQHRLTTLETQPDFDGRFRINELFCYADTWKQALAALVKERNTVLMDLRSFSARKPGCIHELNTLIKLTPLARILLVVDKTTDLAFLEQTLQNAWQAFSTQTDVNEKQPSIKVYKLESSTNPAQALMPWLCASATCTHQSG
jgi:hypothetical protein